MPGGGLLTRDAGTITFVDSFDQDGNFLGEVTTGIHGPHPEAASRFNLACDTLTPILGG